MQFDITIPTNEFSPRLSNTYRVKQIVPESTDIKFYLKEQSINRYEQIRIEKRKKEFYSYIIIGCLLVKVTSLFINIAILEQINSTPTLNWILYILTLFSQFLFGLLVDLVSLPLAFGFSVGLTALGQLFNLFYIFSESKYWLLVSLFLCETAFNGIYVCGLCMIFEYSYDLKHQFRNSSYFFIFGTLVPKIIIEIINQFTNTDSFLQDSTIMTCISIVSLIVGEGLLMYASVQIRIKDYTKAADRYTFFMTRSALSIQEVMKYYSHADFIYLFVVAVLQMQSRDITGEFTKILHDRSFYSFDDQTNNFNDIFSTSSWISSIIFGLPVLFYLNQKQHFITKSYAVIQFIMRSSILVYLIVFLAVLLASNTSIVLVYIVLQSAVIYKAIAGVTLYFICNQIFLCLQDRKIMLKGIGLGIIGILQDITTAPFISGCSEFVLFVIFFSLLIVINIYNYFYRRNRKFDELQKQHQWRFEVIGTLQSSLNSEDTHSQESDVSS